MWIKKINEMEYFHFSSTVVSVLDRCFAMRNFTAKRS